MSARPPRELRLPRQLFCLDFAKKNVAGATAVMWQQWLWFECLACPKSTMAVKVSKTCTQGTCFQYCLIHYKMNEITVCQLLLCKLKNTNFVHFLEEYLRRCSHL